MGKLILDDKLIEKLSTHWAQYQSLLCDPKGSSVNGVQLMIGRQSKVDWNIGSFTVVHQVSGTRGTVAIEQSKQHRQKYRFIYMDDDFCDDYICRFDSFGKDHINIEQDNLTKRKITTPHFHEYTKDGRSIAIKTHILIKNRDYIFANINNGWQEMCNRYSIYGSGKSIPYIYDPMPLLALMPPIVIDPHCSVDFA